MFLIAAICVPIMLLPKPIIMIARMKKHEVVHVEDDVDN
jgi:hypothetical protein